MSVRGRKDNDSSCLTFADVARGGSSQQATGSGPAVKVGLQHLTSAAGLVENPRLHLLEGWIPSLLNPGKVAIAGHHGDACLCGRVSSSSASQLGQVHHGVGRSNNDNIPHPGVVQPQPKSGGGDHDGCPALPPLPDRLVLLRP